MKTKYLFSILIIGALAFAQFAVLRKTDIRVSPTSLAGVPAGAQADADAGDAPVPAYDVRPLRKPKQKYLGVTVKGGADMKRIRTFAKEIDKKPNLVAVFESFDDEFAASEVRKLHEYGALTIIRWEPYDVPLKDIAAGKHDEYVIRFAQAVRELNLPIALTFAHEMNGHWYSWGTKTNKAAHFVAAWRHLHRIFEQQGATNVIWTWTPNVINYLRSVKLKPLYPGDAYVDWVGIDGYYTVHGQKTFADLFGPTMREIRTFTKRPMLIVETGAEPAANRPEQIENLLTTVAASKDLIGVTYFDINGSGQWNIDRDRAALRAFARGAGKDVYGFDIRTLR